MSRPRLWRVEILAEQGSTAEPSPIGWRRRHAPCSTCLVRISRDIIQGEQIRTLVLNFSLQKSAVSLYSLLVLQLTSVASSRYAPLGRHLLVLRAALARARRRITSLFLAQVRRFCGQNCKKKLEQRVRPGAESILSVLAWLLVTDDQRGWHNLYHLAQRMSRACGYDVTSSYVKATGVFSRVLDGGTIPRPHSEAEIIDAKLLSGRNLGVQL